MKIYVVISLQGEEMENVFVSTDEEKALSLTPADFEGSDALFVEVWEDGGKIDDFRLQ
ncbi:hypothetical protein [Paenibacillus xerothermodurans]|uniref:hypothetical protein n=1 Tax=Paenibacillus xerothermodurans TaxID=1977292 RepID=UPI001402078C|nr:hypothetical protein [Paenibacillus xerothermodurans]